jgi:hypothetical protein
MPPTGLRDHFRRSHSFSQSCVWTVLNHRRARYVG